MRLARPGLLVLPGPPARSVLPVLLALWGLPELQVLPGQRVQQAHKGLSVPPVLLEPPALRVPLVLLGLLDQLVL